MEQQDRRGEWYFVNHRDQIDKVSHFEHIVTFREEIKLHVQLYLLMAAALS